jgi:Initiator Replication protein
MHDFRRHAATRRPRADISQQGYIRAPRSLIESFLPKEWTSLDLKVFIYLYSKINMVNPRGEQRLRVTQARKWLGVTKKEIAASLHRLRDFRIRRVYETVTLLDGCGVQQVPFLTDADVIGTDMRWFFSPHFLSLMAEEGHYGKVHLEVVRQLTTRAAIQLYMLGSLMQQMRNSGAAAGCDYNGRPVSVVYKIFYWTPAQLKDYLGVRPDARLGNFITRVVNPAIKKIKATGAFNDPKTKALYEKNGKGRAHETTLIRFRFEGEGWVPRNWKGEFAKTKLAVAEALREKERLDEQAALEEHIRLQRREAWERMKEAAVAGETLQ